MTAFADTFDIPLKLLNDLGVQPCFFVAGNLDNKLSFAEFGVVVPTKLLNIEVSLVLFQRVAEVTNETHYFAATS